MFGGGVQNANHLLVKLLSTLHDENGKVSIDQFYDEVLELTKFEKEQIKALGFDEEKLKIQLGLTELTGGEGTKTVIPKEAHANITCRLVNNQNPEKIQGLIKKHLEEQAPKREGGSIPIVSDFNHTRNSPVVLMDSGCQMKISILRMNILT